MAESEKQSQEAADSPLLRLNASQQEIYRRDADEEHKMLETPDYKDIESYLG